MSWLKKEEDEALTDSRKKEEDKAEAQRLKRERDEKEKDKRDLATSSGKYFCES